ncbi:MAG: hypothetical protein Q8878_09685, partial [Bacillota bacterium]|nr:hypothetical protein [Bacillota bacterium]
PAWAYKYVGWLYESGLTKGVSAVLYGSGRNITLKQYALYLARTLMGPGISDDGWTYCASKDEEELWDKSNGFFNRDAAVGLSVRALSLYYSACGNYMTMAQLMIKRGMFTVSDFGSASWDVLPSSYSESEKDGKKNLVRFVADIPVAECAESGLFLAVGSKDSPLKYLHAVRKSDGGAEFFILDPKTLAVSASDVIKTDGGFRDLTYLGSVDGKDYLIENSADSETGITKSASLYCWDGKYLKLVISAPELWKNGIPPVANEDCGGTGGSGVLTGYYGFTQSFTADGTLLIAGYDTLFYITKEGIIKNPYPAGTQILDFDGKVAVSQLEGDKDTLIRCTDALTGKVLDEYSAVNYTGDSGRNTVTNHKFGYFYGEAGLYMLSDGRLKKLSSRPALDLAFVRWGASMSDPIILTRKPGELVSGMNGPGGDMIVIISLDGSEKVLLSNDPPHGIDIAGIFGSDSSVCFYSAQDVGMQHFNKYTYVVLSGSENPSIYVMDYEAGRPETEKGWSVQNPDGYKKAYIDKEQARLNALGYGG